MKWTVEKAREALRPVWASASQPERMSMRRFDSGVLGGVVVLIDGKVECHIFDGPRLEVSRGTMKHLTELMASESNE